MEKKKIDNIKNNWSKLKPATKRYIIIGILIVMLIPVGLITHKNKVAKIEKAVAKKEAQKDHRKELVGENKYIEKNMFNDLKERLSAIEEKEKEKKDSKEKDSADKTASNEKKESPEPKPAAASGQKKSAPGAAVFPSSPLPTPLQPASGQKEAAIAGQPPIPGSVPLAGAKPAPPGAIPSTSPAQPPAKQFEIIGDIAFAQGKQSKKAEVKTDDKDKKKEIRVVKLPSGTIMKANILVGGNASTMQTGKGEPEPILLRVNDITVLPSDVKARMEGCFVTGEMTGNLGNECAKVRLLRLACIDKKGNALIDQDVTGYVSDEAGENCLRGDVTWKGGAMISRTILIALLGGGAKALETATSPTTAVGATGVFQTSQPSTGEAFTGGVGHELAKTSEDIKKIFVDLIKQSSPVIRVGVTREVGIVISKGVDLEIKEFKALDGVALGVAPGKKR